MRTIWKIGRTEDWKIAARRQAKAYPIFKYNTLECRLMTFRQLIGQSHRTAKAVTTNVMARSNRFSGFFKICLLSDYFLKANKSALQSTQATLPGQLAISNEQLTISNEQLPTFQSFGFAQDRPCNLPTFQSSKRYLWVS
jgi:hypothetical protein